MSTGRWDINQGTDDCMCFDVSLEAARYRAYMIANGFDPEPQLVMRDGSVLVKCEGHRTARFVKHRFVHIQIEGNRITRHA